MIVTLFIFDDLYMAYLDCQRKTEGICRIRYIFRLSQYQVKSTIYAISEKQVLVHNSAMNREPPTSLLGLTITIRNMERLGAYQTEVTNFA